MHETARPEPIENKQNTPTDTRRTRCETQQRPDMHLSQRMSALQSGAALGSCEQSPPPRFSATY